MRRLRTITFSVFLLIALRGASPAQTTPRTVCETLTSAADHQEVHITGEISGSYRHGFGISEGINGDPCPGWRRQFLTSPSVIPLSFKALAGVRLTEEQERLNQRFFDRLFSLDEEHQLGRFKVSVTGVFIRRPWPLIFRRADGTYFGMSADSDAIFPGVLIIKVIEEAGSK